MSFFKDMNNKSAAICPKCKSTLEEVTNKYVCINENCDYFIAKKYFNLEDKSINNNDKVQLNESILEENLWCKGAFDSFPSIISKEYKMLYTYYANNNIFGVMFKIKDVFEVLIKFLVLIVASAIYNKPQLSSSERKLLLSLMDILSLGNWREIANLIVKEDLAQFDDIKIILVDLLKIYNSEKEDIVKWRNETIGHGALKLEDDAEFRKDLMHKIYLIKAHFDKRYKQYSSMTLSLYDGEEKIRSLNDDVKSAKLIQPEIWIEFFCNKQKLNPFIFSNNGNIYFYDSYLLKKKKTILLDYINAQHKRISLGELDNIIEISKESMQKEQIDLILKSKVDVESDTYLASEEEFLEKIKRADDYINPQYIYDQVSNWINTYNKGIFLIQMNSGMGKSTFVRALDPHSMAKLSFDNVSIRCQYINESYGSRVDFFITNFKDTMRKDNYGKFQIMGKEPFFHTESVNLKKSFLDALKFYKDEHRKYFSKDKLLFIIDGVDEIAISNKNILDFMPNHEELEDDIYILITCRTEKETSSFINKKIESISFTSSTTYCKYDKNYNYLLREYIKSNFHLADDNVDTFLEKSEYSLVYLRFLKDITSKIKVSDITNLDKLFDYYLDFIKNNYGSQYYEKMSNLILSIAIFPKPLNLKQIAFLNGIYKINFYFLAQLEDIKGLLRLERTESGTLYSIAHKEIKNVILNKFSYKCQEFLIKIISDFNNLVSESSDNLVQVSDDEMIVLDNLIFYDGFIVFQQFNPQLLNTLVSYYKDKSQKFLVKFAESLLDGNARFEKQDVLINELDKYLIYINKLSELRIISGVRERVQANKYKAFIYLLNYLMDDYLFPDGYDKFYLLDTYKLYFPNTWYFNIYSRSSEVSSLLRLCINLIDNEEFKIELTEEFVKCSCALILLNTYETSKKSAEEEIIMLVKKIEKFKPNDACIKWINDVKECIGHYSKDKYKFNGAIDSIIREML